MDLYPYAVPTRYWIMHWIYVLVWRNLIGWLERSHFPGRHSLALTDKFLHCVHSETAGIVAWYSIPNIWLDLGTMLTKPPLVWAQRTSADYADGLIIDQGRTVSRFDSIVTQQLICRDCSMMWVWRANVSVYWDFSAKENYILPGPCYCCCH